MITTLALLILVIPIADVLTLTSAIPARLITCVKMNIAILLLDVPIILLSVPVTLAPEIRVIPHKDVSIRQSLAMMMTYVLMTLVTLPQDANIP
jgi:hypothetical protein